jgi:predicted O-methyltransferase YrrM
MTAATPPQADALALWTRLVAGDRFRKTRFHDAQGHFVGARRLLGHGPAALATAVLRKAFGHRQERPWISYAAARAIRSILNKNSVVLEFGSGMSTLWLARHSGRVYSVEASPEWFEAVSGRLRDRNLTHVTYALQSARPAYCGFPADESRRFDFVLVDGAFRAACVETALRRVAEGGYIYVDDVDDAVPPWDREMELIETRLREAVRRCGGTLAFFTDFAPGHFVAKRGLLAHFAKRPSDEELGASTGQ